jgi:hypothetical protein
MTGRDVFVDTSAWVALRYRRDGRHARARSLLRKLRAEGLRMVTSEWVCGETVTLLKVCGAFDHAIALGEAMQAGRLGLYVESTHQRRERAWAMFRRYRGLDAGWVDCTSFAVMEELGIQSYFGFDDDFSSAGFTSWR